jgi:hypothetical protein
MQGGHPTLRAGGLVLGASFVVVGLVAFLPASTLVLDQSCEPGPVGRLKSAARGRAFWERQLEYLDEKIAWYVAGPERRARIEEELAPPLADVDRLLAREEKRLEALYERYPVLRASPEALDAAESRARAEVREAAALEADLERMRKQIIRRLRACRREIEGRLSR